MLLMMIMNEEYEIRGSHSSKDVDVSLLGCNAMRTCRSIPTYLPPQYVPLKCWYLDISTHGITTQKSNVSNKRRN
jgi:hypothetical protein